MKPGLDALKCNLEVSGEQFSNYWKRISYCFLTLEISKSNTRRR